MTRPKKSKLYTEAEVHEKLCQQMFKELLQNHFPKAVPVIKDGQTFYDARIIDEGFKKLDQDTIVNNANTLKLLEELKTNGTVNF